MKGRRKKIFLSALLSVMVFSFVLPLSIQPTFAADPEAKANAGAVQAEKDQRVNVPPPPKATNDDGCTASWNPVNWALCGAIALMQYVFKLVIYILGTLAIILSEILLMFAQYNQFGSAKAVSIGWGIVRDICNMFFIVIILISAFASILQYDTSNFHYSKVLPKLLLMAVLINFSKTLIMLLIDFSQVVMLTFVNAFRQAAAGNLVQTLGLTSYLSAAQDGTGSGSTAANMLNILASYALAVALLIIANGVLIIFIAYILARIIGLWIALIFSPIALFETAVPHRLQKGMSTFTNKYWSRLGAMLSGGPIIAFFLWLTFAVVQGTAAASGDSGLASELGLSKGYAPGFLSAIGNTQGLASFIIGVALMLMGLDAAVDASNEIGSSTLSAFAKNVQGKTIGAAKWALRKSFRPVTRPAEILKDKALAGAGGLAGLGIKGAGVLQDQINKIPGGKNWATKLGSGLVRGLGLGTVGLASSPLLAVKKAAQDERMADMAQMKKKTEGMGYEDKIVFANSITGATKVDKQLKAELLAEAASDKGQLDRTKTLAKKYEEQIKKENEGIDPGEAKRQAFSHAMAEVSARAGRESSAAKQLYESLGNNEKVAEMDKLIEQNPFLEPDEGKFNGTMNKVRLDPEKMKALSSGAKSRGRVLMQALPAGAIKVSGNTITGYDQAQVDSFLAQNKDNTELVKNVQAMLNHIPNDGIGTVPLEDIRGMILQKGPRGEMRAYGSGGAPMATPEEKAARGLMETHVTKSASKGRSGSVLTGDAERAVMSNLVAGSSLGSVLDQAGKNASGTRDRAVEAMLADRMRSAVTAAGRAVTPAGDTDKAALDAAMTDFVSIASQLEDPGVDEEAQLQLLMGVEAGGAATVLPDQWEEMGRTQKRSVESLVKVAAARVEQLAKKRAAARAAGTTYSEKPGEKEVERLVEAMKKKWPSHRTKVIDPSTGAVTKEIPQAPHNIGQSLYGSS